MRDTYRLKNFAKYASLNVLGMLGLSCYILADTFFISKGLGANGLTALNLAIPVYSLIHGSGLMIGMGGGIRYAILHGQGRSDAVDQVFTNALCLALSLAVIFFGLGLGCSGPIARMLGADDAVFGMSRTYLQVLLLFSPMFLLNNVLLCFVRNDGAPQLSMAAMVCGSFVNIILDYIFVFPLHMGIFGAVLATGFSPMISILIMLPFFLQKKNHFHLCRCKVSGQCLTDIVSGGLPSLITELSSGIVILVSNMIILRLAGNVGVAAYGVIANLSLVVISIYTGIAQGIQPIVSDAHGRGQSSDIQAILRYALATLVFLSTALYACIFFGTEQITAVFNSGGDPILQKIASAGLCIYFTGGLFAGYNIILSAYLTSIERSRPAHILSFLRGFLLIIPMSFLLSSVGGMTGVWLAFPVTEGMVSLIGALLKNRRCTPRTP